MKKNTIRFQSSLKVLVVIIAALSFDTPHARAALESKQFPVIASANSAQSRKLLTVAVDNLCRKHFKADLPGATVIVIKNGRVVLRKAYGLANVETRTQLKPNMALPVASLTKQFTAAAIMLLVEEGKIDLGDRLRNYVPEYPIDADDVTIENLLTHTSGIPNHFSSPSFDAVAGKDVTVDQAIAFFKEASVTFRAGEKYDYSNTNYFLLGAIIERVSGMSYEEFIDRRIFKPLGMTHSRLDTPDKKAPQAVAGYVHSGGRLVAVRSAGISWVFSAGALRTNVDDLAIWGNVITSKRLLSSKSWRMITTSFRLVDGEPTGYGYGLAVGLDDIGSYVRHSGLIDGFNASQLIYPGRGIFVAVLQNTSIQDPAAQTVSKQIATLVGDD